MTEPPSDLDGLAGELESAAARLRSGDLDADGAAELVDECARLASRAAAQLDSEARASEPAPGQDSLI
jgi:hypothetical protein